MATKKKFLLKDQKALLDQILSCQEEDDKIAISLMKLKERERRLKKRLNRICKNLDEGLQVNGKDLDSIPPFLYKGRTISVEREHRMYKDYEYSIDITTPHKI